MAKIIFYSVIVFISFICITSYWFVTAYWYWLIDVNNQIAFGAIIAAITSTIGALIGAVLGGLLSFIGNKVGANENFKLIKQWNENNATKQIIKQLKYTVKTARVSVEMWEKYKRTNKPSGSKNIMSINLSLYDNEWPKELGLSKLDNLEYEEVIQWYTQLDLVTEDGNIDVETLVKIANVRLDKISSIIEKYDV